MTASAKRLLFLAPQPFFQDRGTPIAVRALLRVLADRGYLVDLVTYHEGADVDIPGCRIHRIPAVPGLSGIRPGFSLKKVACDALLFLKALRLAGSHRYDLIHAVEEAVFIGVALGSMFRIPLVYDMDSSLSRQMTESYPILRPVRSMLDRFEQYAIRRSRGVLAVCQVLEDQARASSPASIIARAEDVTMLADQENGVEDLRETVGTSGKLVLYVGNLEPYQGIDLLLEGFRYAAESPAAADAHLVIIGGSDHHITKHEQRTISLGIADRVHFLGPRPVSRLGSYLRQAEVLVSPRIRGRNTPMKVYSYLDSGRALLATRLITHTQVLDDSIACLVAPDSREFGAGLVRLLEDPRLRDRLARNARERVREQFTPEAFRAKVNDFYDAVEAELADDSAASSAEETPRNPPQKIGR